jgi:hypothetical protein
VSGVDTQTNQLAKFMFLLVQCLTHLTHNLTSLWSRHLELYIMYISPHRSNFINHVKRFVHISCGSNMHTRNLLVSGGVDGIDLFTSLLPFAFVNRMMPLKMPSFSQDKPSELNSASFFVNSDVFDANERLVLIRAAAVKNRILAKIIVSLTGYQSGVRR